MISDPVQRWRRQLGESTWETYEPKWNMFLEFMKIADSKELLELSKQEANDLAIEFYHVMKNKRYSRNSCALGYAAVRSFFEHNSKPLGKFNKKFSGKVQYEQGYLMTQQQVFQLIEAVPKWHNKFAGCICFQGGQRCGVCTALKFRHIQTRNWKEARIVVFDIPEFLPNNKGRNVNKREVKYRFALLNDAMRYLVLHVQDRERKGEQITSDSWIIRSGSSTVNNVKPITSGRINKVVVTAADRIGIQSYTETARGDKKALIHAQIGRIYFKAQMRKSGVDPELRNFMMGHQLSLKGAYDRFNEAELVNAMESARKFLVLAPKVVSELQWQKEKLLEDATKVLPPAKLEELKKVLAYATTMEQLEEGLEQFKNGRTKLEYLKR